MNTSATKITASSILLFETKILMALIKDLRSASALMDWDRETYMPLGGAEDRADQLATLDTLAHEYLTNEKAHELVKRIENEILNCDPSEKPLFAVFLEDFEKATKLSSDLVGRTSKAQALAQISWRKAREENNFKLFSEDLQKIIDLKIEAAECYGYSENRYDALLDLFEPDVKASELRNVFNDLRKETIGILSQVKASHKEIDESCLFQPYEESKQMEFAKFIAAQMGFDFNNGRLDLTTHPFCTSFSVRDVRLTTRIYPNDIRSCLMGVIHEAGHGLYEQGFAKKYARTFVADGASFGIHESQSLFWEKIIAGSEEFWHWAFPHLQKAFPEQTQQVTPRRFYEALNKIQPSFIRTEADELTYNLHIILRFEIEDDLINQRIKVSDIPEIWNAKMKESLGIVPAGDAEGCLQDVHWSFGGFGYFPSYTLGKLYSAMMWTQMQKEIPTVKSKIANGEFEPIKLWLGEKVHQYGRAEKPIQLIKRITDRDLDANDFINGVKAKVQNIYG
ncbi:MAG: carboxypeptidase M32 [Candidatus Melainabacteria bacterium]|jgi:carboxypeptidase Taq